MPIEASPSSDADFPSSASTSLPPTPPPAKNNNKQQQKKPQRDMFKEALKATFHLRKLHYEANDDRSFSEPLYYTEEERAELRRQQQKMSKNSKNNNSSNLNSKIPPEIDDEPAPVVFRGQYRKNTRTMTNRHMSSLHEHKRNSRFQNYGEAVGLFKNYTRRIMHLLRWFAELKKSEVLREHVKQITDMLLEHERQAKEQERLRETYFDRTQFASRREVVISQENALILTLKGASRTADQVKQVVNNLAWAISSFAEYPIGMQYGLAGVAMYQRINPQRVIIRQGHYPENFYFIISGWAQVIICKQIGGNSSEYEQKTVAKIGKGQCFGEIALIHQTTRQATVESVTEMELLVITKYDFFKIFLAKPDTLDEPEYVKLLRTLTFLHDWPIEKIDEQPGACILHFFRPGTVVVSDSNTSNWIYIVKSGSCTVMKKLKHVVPSRQRNVASNIDTTMAESMFGSRKIYPRIDNGKPRPNEKPPITELINQDGIFAEIDEEHISYLKKLEADLRAGEPPRFSYDVYLYEFPRLYADLSQDDFLYKPPEEKDAEERRRIPGNDKQAPESKLAKKQKLYEALYAAPKAIAGSENKSKKSIFVQMGLLREGDVFGLEDIQFDDDIPTSRTSVCLVSRGSELVMFSKDLFLKHVTAQGKDTLRKIVKPYPDESILQHNLQVELDWRLYRTTILEEEMSAKKAAKSEALLRTTTEDLTDLRKWQ